MPADFPTSKKTFPRAVNNIKHDLAANVYTGEGIIIVTSTTGSPTAPFWFHINAECIYCPEKTATDYGTIANPCLRGQDGTSDVDHLIQVGGGEVKFGLEAHYLNEAYDEIEAIENEIGITGAKNYVAKTGNETIADIKTFSSSPIVPTPTTDYQAATKKYADDLIVAGEIITEVASSATPTPAIASKKTVYIITALAEAATFGVPTGSPTQNNTLLYRIKDNATARALSFNAIYRAGTDISLPTTTVLSKTLYIGFMYNSTDTKWDLLFVTDGY